MAVTDGTAIDLRDSKGLVRATYSGLRVVDASGKVAVASMHATSQGKVIALQVRDGGVRYPLMVDPTWTALNEINSSDGLANDSFGDSVAVSGTTAVVGAAGHTVGGLADAGAAYVFSFSGGTWSQTAELDASDGAANDQFGGSVAISGGTVVVGAAGHMVAGLADAGAAYVFSESGGSWSQTAELTASDGAPSDLFGGSVAISDAAVVVGATGHTVGTLADAGAAYIFSSSGGSWSPTKELTASDFAAQDQFGGSVAISGTTAVVGATGHTVDAGAAYIFSSSGGAWSQTGELTASDGAAHDLFGGSVAISGTTAVVGAAGHTVGGLAGAGAAYVFTSTSGVWSQSGELTASDGVAHDLFGGSVAISGTTAVAGAEDHAVSANADAGSAYVFASTGGAWAQTGELAAFDGASNDQFGQAVGISGTTVVAGAAQHTVSPKADEGAGYLFSSGLVTPQGSGFGADSWGGGSPSEPCIQCNATTPSTSASGGSGAAGQVVDPATGDVSVTATDVSLPGAGIALGFTRTYDADAAQAEATAGLAAPALGYGWSDNLSMTVAYNSMTQTATVTEENGAQLTYTTYVAGTSPAWCTGTANFCSTAPRVAATLNHNTGGTWTFTRSTGNRETFTFIAAGVLTQIIDVAGDTLTLSTYSPTGGQTVCPASNTCTGWTSSASGRELVLAVNTSGELTSVFDANSTLASSFVYTGSGLGCTSWGGTQTPDLCTVTDPGGLTATYTYDSGNATVAFDYELLSYTPPGASAATVNLYTAGQVTQVTDPSGAVTSYAYAGTSSAFLGGSTTITAYPLGVGGPQQVTVDSYSSNVLIEQMTGAATAAAASQFFEIDPVSLMPLWSVDGDGHITYYSYQTYNGTGGTAVSSANVLTTDVAGNVTLKAYNSFNQVWCSVDAADYANGARCPTSAPTTPLTPDPNLGTVISFYNSSDQLTAQTDALGNTTTYTYTSGVTGVPNGLMYCSVDPADYGHATCPAYGAAHVTGTTMSAFDAYGDRTASTDADGDTTTYTYGLAALPGVVSSETDPDGTTTAYGYNGAGQTLSQTIGFGTYSAATLDAYDSLGRQYCEEAAHEVAAHGAICPSSPPSSAPTPGSDPYLGATITSYDANGRVIQTTNPLGGITYTGYDQAGNTFCTVDPSQAATGVTCPTTAPTTPPTPASDPYLGATITTYNAAAQPVQVTSQLGGITLTVYDSAGNVIQTTVESNNNTTTADPIIVTANAYDADNRLTSTTIDPGSTTLAATTLTSYDPNSNAYCTVSATAVGGATNFQCPAWQHGWITAPPNPTALYSTTPTAAQANDVTTTFFDANGDQVQTTDPDVQTSITAVDGDGRTYCTSDPTNVGAWLTAHSGGAYPYLCPAAPPSTAPAGGSDPGYVTTIFDAAGRTSSSTDQIGDTTSYTYAPGGQTLTTSNPRGKVTTNCYYYQTTACAAAAPANGGSGDDLYSTTTPVTAADPSGAVTTTTYYPGDQVNVATTPAGTTTDTYDPAGNLTTVAYSATAAGYATPTNLAYTFNVDSTRHSMIDATGTTTYAYDRAGDLTNQALVAKSGLANAATGYSYYTTGILAAVTYPTYRGATSPQETYSYDGTGAMISATDWLGNKVTFGHDGDGNTTAQDNNVSGGTGTSSTAFSYDSADENTKTVSSLTQACGGTQTLTQAFSTAGAGGGSRNPDGQLTQYQSTYGVTCSGQTSYQRNYSYDQAGRVGYQGTTAQGGAANTFAYDPSDDPTTLSSHDSSGSFDTYTQTYDSAGEVTAQTPIGGSGGTSSTYTYDTLGDQTTTTPATGAATGYAYDQAAHLIAVGPATTPSTPAATYAYNGDGLQAAETTPMLGSATLSILAGTGATGAPTAGPATSSTLTSPRGMAVDASGNTYIADASNNVVEKVTASGVLSVFAGTGTAGTPTAGAATSSKLNGPVGVAVDSAGNVYIADANNDRIEKVTSAGTLSVFAGTGTAGSPTAGPATSSKLDIPRAVAVDSSGNVYIADTTNNMIEKVTPAGTLSVFAGTGTAGTPTAGPATSSNLNAPHGVGVDSSGNVYIADTTNNMIEKVTPAGTLSVLAGTGTAGAATPGAATSSKLSAPDGVAVDSSGNVYIADTTNNMIEAVAPTGTLSVFAGTGTAGPATPGASTRSALNGPAGVAVTSQGAIDIADSNNNTIEINVPPVTGSGTLAMVAGTGTGGAPTAGPATNSELHSPRGAVADSSGNTYIADVTNNVVEKVTAAGTLSIFAGTGTAGTPTAGPATSSNLNGPVAVTIDSAGNIYIADATNNRIEKVTPAGILSFFAGTGTAGTPTAGPALSSKLNTPRGVAVDSSGNVYIADATNNRIEKVTAAGTLSVFAGTGTAGTPTAGPALSSKLNSPRGVAVDSAGNVYIADQSNSLVEKVTAVGTLSVFAGTGTAGPETPGPATSSNLNAPPAVAVDNAGNVYIADMNNSVIEQVTPAGTLSIVAGTGTAGEATPGASTRSDLKLPAGITVTSFGTIDIADTNNNTIETDIPPAAGTPTLTVLAGTGTAGGITPGLATSSNLQGPRGTATDSAGNTYIADTLNNTIDKVTPTGTLSLFAGIGTAGTPTAGPATSSRLNNPKGVGVDSAGNVYIADANNNMIEKVTPTGTLSLFAGTGTAGTPTAGPATSSKLDEPVGVAADSTGNVYIGDYLNNRVEKVTPTGTLSILAGTGTAGAPTPGPATSSKLNGPEGVAVDGPGNVYIADASNNTIDKVTPTGTLSIFAGTGTTGVPTPGPATSSKLGRPQGVALDPAGNVYIADASTDNFIEKVTPTGTLTIVAGTGITGNPTPGPANNSNLNVSIGVSTDNNGNIYIADANNNLIEKLAPTLTQTTWNTTADLPTILTDTTNDYIYGPTDTPIEQINLTTNTPTYLTYTPTNDTWLSTNNTGNQTGYWAYDAYGTPSFGTPESPFGYSGQYTDTTTQLVNDRARNYQPQTGNFTTTDPDLATTDTAYTYANDDPVGRTDPSGLSDHFSQYCFEAGCFGGFVHGVGRGFWELNLWITNSPFGIYEYAFFLSISAAQLGEFDDYILVVGSAFSRRSINAPPITIKLDTYWTIVASASAWGLFDHSHSGPPVRLFNP